GSGRNGLRLVDRAQPNAGVQQMPHFSASHSVATGSSMSGGSGTVPGHAPTNVLGFGSGTMRATRLPRLSTCTVSPASNHLEMRLNSLRRSRTVAVFIVRHMYHKWIDLSKNGSTCLCLRGVGSSVEVGAALRFRSYSVIQPGRFGLDSCCC